MATAGRRRRKTFGKGEAFWRTSDILFVIKVISKQVPPDVRSNHMELLLLVS